MAKSSEDGLSLIALTSHFAQVQFRLKQITAAPPDHRESLLAELEKFAFQGCPVQLSYDTVSEGEQGSTEQQHQSLHNLLTHLQSQIQEASSQFQETPPVSPTALQKESIIIDELRKKFNMQFGDIENMSEDELRSKVGELVSATTYNGTKDHLVRQLASQVRAMEDHISQLQHELSNLTSPPPIPVSQPSPTDIGIHYEVSWCQQASQDELLTLHHASSQESLVGPLPVTNQRSIGRKDPQNSIRTLRRTLAVMQILTLWQCGGMLNCLPKSSAILSKSHTNYPNAMRVLELAVDKISIITTALSQPGQIPLTCVRLESELHDEVSMNLSDALKELLENGYEGAFPGPPTSCLVPFNWMKGNKLEGDSRDCSAWHTLLYYYNLKKGPKICEKPEHKLSSSFGLPIDRSSPAKTTLLNVLHRTEKGFRGCKNYSPDLKFRAFVCQGFNLHHLGDWMKLMVHHPTLVNDLYRPSSFITTTKFRPVIQCLERLTQVQCNCTVELPPSYYHHVNVSSQ